jgi:type VI secretion system protein ImpK
MIDNPFAEPEDDARTLIRPTPGGRRTSAPVDATTGPAATDAAIGTTVIAPRSRPRRAPVPPGPIEHLDTPLVGGGPLMAAAMPLLQLLARLRNTLTPPDAGTFASGRPRNCGHSSSAHKPAVLRAISFARRITRSAPAWTTSC